MEMKELFLLLCQCRVKYYPVEYVRSLFITIFRLFLRSKKNVLAFTLPPQTTNSPKLFVPTHPPKISKQDILKLGQSHVILCLGCCLSNSKCFRVTTQTKTAFMVENYIFPMTHCLLSQCLSLSQAALVISFRYKSWLFLLLL